MVREPGASDSNLNLPFFSEFCNLGILFLLSCLDLHLSLVEEARDEEWGGVTGTTAGLLVSGTWGRAQSVPDLSSIP